MSVKIFIFFTGITSQPEEIVQLTEDEEISVTMESQNIDKPQMVSETMETISLEVPGSDISTSETEEVSFELVTKEQTETAPEEVTMETTAALPATQEEVPLAAAVPEISEVDSTEIDIVLGPQVTPETVEETTVTRELHMPDEELPVIESAPEEEEVKVAEQPEEFAAEVPTGEAPKFTTELSPITVNEGDQIHFVCVVTGSPRPKVGQC